MTRWGEEDAGTLVSMMLTKHHGLGNDFLIAVDPQRPITSDHARRWCHRRRGIGADGLIALESAGDDELWSMTLWNADGGQAEVSGNGLRCVGQALVLHNDDGSDDRRFRVATGSGERLVVVSPDRAGATDLVTVDMGRPSAGSPPSPRWASLGLEPRAQLGIGLGNPHLVALFDELTGIDMDVVGPVVEADYGQGMNVHAIRVVGGTKLELLVWERGVGVTEACGSGACAAAWAAASWGLVESPVEVVMPGGSALVEIVDGALSLTGPATLIGVIEVVHS